MTFSGCAQALVAPDGAIDPKRRRVSASEQIVCANAQPAAESDQQVQRRDRMSPLNTGDVLVRNPQLAPRVLPASV